MSTGAQWGRGSAGIFPGRQAFGLVSLLRAEQEEGRQHHCHCHFTAAIRIHRAFPPGRSLGRCVAPPAGDSEVTLGSSEVGGRQRQPGGPAGGPGQPSGPAPTSCVLSGSILSSRCSRIPQTPLLTDTQLRPSADGTRASPGSAGGCCDVQRGIRSSCPQSLPEAKADRAVPREVDGGHSPALAAAEGHLGEGLSLQAEVAEPRGGGPGESTGWARPLPDVLQDSGPPHPSPDQREDQRTVSSGIPGFWGPTAIGGLQVRRGAAALKAESQFTGRGLSLGLAALGPPPAPREDRRAGCGSGQDNGQVVLEYLGARGAAVVESLGSDPSSATDAELCLWAGSLISLTLSLFIYRWRL